MRSESLLALWSKFDKYGLINVKTFLFLPVNHDCPDDRCQQNFVSFEGDAAPMKEERKMRANHDSKPLSEVPVPGMRAVEVCYTM